MNHSLFESHLGSDFFCVLLWLIQSCINISGIGWLVGGSFMSEMFDFSKIQLVVYYISMLHSDWLSYYQANNICYSPLVAKSAGFLAAKKGLKSSFS